MTNKNKLLITIISLALSSTALANIYKWTDKKGNVHYTAHPPAKTETKSEAKEFKVTKKSASSLTHNPRRSNTVSTNTETSNSSRRKATRSRSTLDTTAGRAVHCKKIVNTQSFSKEMKTTEIAKCMRNLQKASPEDKKRAVETLKVMLE